jgi:integrase/recombinase XerC
VRCLNEFKQWMIAQGFQSCTASTAVITLSGVLRYAIAQGRVRWRFPTPIQLQGERAWKATSPRYRALLRGWLSSLSLRGYATSTLATYKCGTLRFGAHLAKKGVEVSGVTPEVLLDWMAHERGRGLAAQTIRDWLRISRVFYAWLRKRGIVSEDPFADVPRMRLRHSVPEHFSESEMVRVVEHARTRRDRAIMEVFYATGCRVGEIAGIDLVQVCLQSRLIRCMGKGRKERLLFLNRPSVRAIRAYLPERQEILKRYRKEGEPALFLGRLSKRLTVRFMGAVVRSVIRQAGLTGSAHKIRHSFATHLLNRGASFRSVMDLMGHSTPEITAHYAQPSKAYIRKAYRKACPRR